MKSQIKENLFDYLLYALILILPFSQAIPNIILVLISLLFLKDLTFNKIKETFFSPIIMLLFLIVYLSLKGLFFKTLTEDFLIYKGYFLTLWLLMVLQKVENWGQLKLFILLSINAMVVTSFFFIGNYYYHYHQLPFVNTEEVNSLLVQERPYAGFMAVLGFFLSFEFIKIFPKHKILFIADSIVMIVFVLLISARLSILTIFCVLIVYLLFYFKISIYKKIGSILLLILLLGSMFFINKNIAQRFFIKDNINKSLQEATDYEPRIVIWNCAKEMLQNNEFNFFFGFDSYKKISNNYLECYSSNIKNSSKRDYFLTIKFNSHNQIIDFFLIGGLIGLGLLFGFFFIMFYNVKDNFFETALLVSILFFFIVENVLYRQFGCYIFSIFVAMLVVKNPTVNDEN
ncbi:O-antigen ligase family protein [Flavobacterium psychrotolerans]|uniref:O-antigen ligase-related domain-containing protein n=1 Tax=Flavobacterium psychrotolerans TaxID=2169410 RepID=A0A2U1JNW5_9FLAO|nr:O-antigen ligase family protein [Flavobacterium psychrotolerans]PWA06870.1 hypothetical protein DB895_02490 [Flavobacterium psychrotolerans]